MSTLAPIPLPPRQRWRIFCTEFLPLAIFAGGIAAAFALWGRTASAPTLIAEAEALQIDLRSPQAGTLAELDVALLQPVAAGTEVAKLAVADPALAAATLAVVRTELAALAVTMGPAIDQQRVNLDFTRLKLDWMRERVELAALRVELGLAESNLTRLAAVHDASAISDQALDAARTKRDSLRRQLEEQTRLVAELEPTLHRLDPTTGSGSLPTVEPALRAALDVQESKLRLAEARLAPVTLRAPISGYVSLVHHQPGETVLAGEPVLQITADRPQRLIGFLRQPLTVEPKPGTPVEIRTRAFTRRVALTTVSEIGHGMEPILPTLLAAMRLPSTPETGLRIHFTPPADLPLRPGEHVDVFFQR